MAILSINTTQNVNIDFVSASVGERVLAFMIDMLIKVSYVYVMSQVLGVSERFFRMLDGVDEWNFVGIVLVIMSPVFFYSLIFETLLGGQTPGKRVMKIKVIKIDGFQASFPDFLARWMVRVIDITLLSGVVGLVTIIITNRNQRLGDMVAGTAVISLKNNVAIQQTIFMNLERSYQPKYPSAAYLSDKDARIIKNAYESALQDRNTDLLIRLTRKLEAVLKIEKGPVEDAVFIGDVLRDFNYYTRGEA